jgi:hypothetical protein
MRRRLDDKIQMVFLAVFILYILYHVVMWSKREFKVESYRVEGGGKIETVK